MATSPRKKRSHFGPLTSSPAERHASRFRLTESEKEWMMNAVNSRCDSVKLFLNASRDGLSGKTYRGYSIQSIEEDLERSSEGWKNSGIVSRGECWTLDTSESHSQGVECLLSEVIDHGDTLQRHYLSSDQVEKMIGRLERNGKGESEWAQVLRGVLSDGLEMKRQNSAKE